MGVFNQIKMIWHKRSSSAYIKYLRKKGIHIGEHCIIRAPRTARIDVSRPSLVTIGNNVDMNMNFQILTHDWASLVFRTKYNDFVNSSGHVTIGNNIYFGTNVVVLKGVTIGDNCVIGGKQSFRAVLCTSIYISTFVPNLNFGQDEHKRRRQVLCLNGS